MNRGLNPGNRHCRDRIRLAPVYTLLVASFMGGCSEPTEVLRAYYQQTTAEGSWNLLSEDAQQLDTWENYSKNKWPSAPRVVLSATEWARPSDNVVDIKIVFADKAGKAKPHLFMRMKRSMWQWKVADNWSGYMLATKLWTNRNVDGAIALLRKSVEVSPYGGQPCWMLAHLELQNGENERALATSALCLHNNPTSAAAALALAETSRAAGRDEAAKEARGLVVSLNCGMITPFAGILEAILSGDAVLAKSCVDRQLLEGGPMKVSSANVLAHQFSMSSRDWLVGDALLPLLENAIEKVDSPTTDICYLRVISAGIRLRATKSCDGKNCAKINIPTTEDHVSTGEDSFAFRIDKSVESVHLFKDMASKCFAYTVPIYFAVRSVTEDSSLHGVGVEDRVASCSIYAEWRKSEPGTDEGDEFCHAAVSQALLEDAQRKAKKAKEQMDAEFNRTNINVAGAEARMKEVDAVRYVRAALEGERTCTELAVGLGTAKFEGFVSQGEPTIRFRQIGASMFKGRRLPAALFDARVQMVNRAEAERKELCFTIALATDHEFGFYRHIMCDKCDAEGVPERFLNWKTESHFSLDP